MAAFGKRLNSKKESGNINRKMEGVSQDCFGKGKETHSVLVVSAKGVVLVVFRGELIHGKFEFEFDSKFSVRYSI